MRKNEFIKLAATILGPGIDPLDYANELREEIGYYTSYEEILVFIKGEQESREA